MVVQWEVKFKYFPIIVSLCCSGNGEFYVPDNGYVSIAPDSLLDYARRIVNKELKQGAKKQYTKRF